MPHQELNASQAEGLAGVLVRNGQNLVVVKLAVESVAMPTEVTWVDPHHAAE